MGGYVATRGLVGALVPLCASTAAAAAPIPALYIPSALLAAAPAAAPAAPAAPTPARAQTDSAHPHGWVCGGTHHLGRFIGFKPMFHEEQRDPYCQIF